MTAELRRQVDDDRTGQLIRDLSVRELLTVMTGRRARRSLRRASSGPAACRLYPNPLPVEEVLKLVGIEAIAERRTQTLSGGETQRARFAGAGGAGRLGLPA